MMYNIFKGSSSPQFSGILASSNLHNISTDSSVGALSDALLMPDYTLSPCSPAINAGFDTSNVGPIDLAGNTRKYGPKVDLGCYEYQSASYLTPVLSGPQYACAGTSNTLSVQSNTLGGTYTWYSAAGNVNTTTTTPSLLFTPITTATYSVSQTAMGCTAYSQPIIITVYPGLTPPYLNARTPNSNSVCVGTAVRASANAGTGGTPGCTDSYRYSINGGATWNAYTPNTDINTVNAAGVVIIQGQRGGCDGCNTTAWLEIARWTITPLAIPTIAIAISNAPVSQGNSASFTATVTNGGAAPVYVWQRNSITVGGNSNTYTDYAPVNGQTVSCSVTSNAACAMPATVTASITVPVVSLTISSAGACAPQTLTAHIPTMPIVLYWKAGYTTLSTKYPTYNNCINVAGGNGNGTGNNQLNQRGIFVDVANNVYVADEGNNRVVKWAPGATTGQIVAGGNGAGNAANQLTQPTAVVVDDTGAIYVMDAGNNRVQKWSPGATVGITVAGGNGSGSALNQIGVCRNIALRNSTIYVSDITNNRVVAWPLFTAFPTPSLVVGGNGAGSGIHQLNGPQGLCFYKGSGSYDYLFVADNLNNRIMKYGMNSPSTNRAIAVSSTTSPLTVRAMGRVADISSSSPNVDLYVLEGSSYRVRVFRNGSNTGAIVAGGNGSGIGANQFVSPVDLFVNSVGEIFVSDFSGTTSAPHTRVQKFIPTIDSTYTPPVGNGLYYAEMVNMRGETLTSNEIEISQYVTPSISITADNEEICTGGYVTFTANYNDYGKIPVIRWYVNGSLTGPAGSAFVSNTLQPGNVVHAVLTSGYPCPTALQTTSNAVTLRAMVPTVSISAYPGSTICPGSAVTFIAVPDNGGAQPSYQWQLNGVPVGGGNTYTSANLNNGDVVSCKMTSSIACSGQAAVTSNAITMRISSINITAGGTCGGSMLTAQVPTVPAVLQWQRNDTVVQTVYPTWNATPTTSIASGAVRIHVDGGATIYKSGGPDYSIRKYVEGSSTGILVAGGNGYGSALNQIYNGNFGVDKYGNVYVCMYGSINRWDVNGNVTEVATGLNSPLDVKFDGAGNMYVLNYGTNSVVKFKPGSANGTTVAGGNGSGSAANQFNNCQRIFVSADSIIYAADQNNNRIQMWLPGATSGVTLAGGGSVGFGANQLSYPSKVWLDGAGILYMLQNNDRVARYDTATKTAVTLITLSSPPDVGMDDAGNIFLADNAAPAIKKYSVNAIPNTYATTAGGVYTAVRSGFNSCSLISNNVTLTNNVLPTINITGSPILTLCAGDSMTFSAIVTNAGTNPIYQWKKNNVNVGTSSPTYNAGVLAYGDSVNCVLTSNAACANPVTVTSAAAKVAIWYSPVAITHNDTIQLDNTGVVTNVAAFIDSSSYDNCSPISLTAYPATTGTVCATAAEGASFTISAPAGMVFTGINFASYGTPGGTCGNFSLGTCHNAYSVQYVKDKLLGKNSATFIVDNNVYGGDPCYNTAKRLYVQASYSPATPITQYTCADAGTHQVVLLVRNQYGGVDAAPATVTVLPPVLAATVSATVCAGDTFKYHGTNYTTSGQYTKTLTSLGGCDSIITLNINVKPVANTSVNAEICSGEKYMFKGIARTGSGVYRDTLTAVNGCDSIVALNLTVKPGYMSGTTTTVCPGYTCMFNGVGYTASGTYTDTLTASNGCDSILTLNLTVRPIVSSTTTVAACGSYTWNGVNYTASGSYSKLFIYGATTGCDSTAYMNLTINQAVTSTTSITACGSFTWNGVAYTTGGSYSKLFVYGATTGCDSTANLNLTINQILSTNISTSICAGSSYNFNGDVLTNAGLYYDTLATVNNCDSIVILTLSIKQPATSTTSITACGSYTWNGVNYTAGGSYSKLFAGGAANGCDSTANLNLTINQAFSTNISASICAGSGYNFSGDMLTNAGVYYDTLSAGNSCDSIVILTLSIKQPTSSTTTITACSSYTWNGVAYTISGSYSALFTGSNGCDSTANLNLTINQAFSTNISASICAGSSYNFNGDVLTSAGIYYDTLSSINNCDSIVILTLNVNQPVTSTTNITACGNYTWNGVNYTTSGSYNAVFTGSNGCDSTANLKLTINQAVTTNISASICAGSSYSFGGNILTNAGVYYDTLSATNSCDSIVILTLSIKQPTSSTTNVTACSSYTWNGVAYTISGNYSALFTGSNGCDSTANLNLNINQAVSTNISASICAGSIYSFGGKILTNAGVYYDTLSAANSCDSVVALTLTIKQPTSSTTTITVCGSYTWNGVSYTTNGSYSALFTGSNGCDSTVYLNLTINQAVSTNISASICAGSIYSFGGNTLTSEGVYYDTLSATNSCDSIVILTLAVKQPTSSTTTITACDIYTWNGVNYTTNGNYSASFTGSNGCDSTANLNLIINQAFSTNISATICAGSSYNFNGDELTSAGIHYDTLSSINNCDSIVILTLSIKQPATSTTAITTCGSYTWNGVNYTTSGSYSAVFTGANGCDSTANLNLTINQAVSSNINASICAGDAYSFNGNMLTSAGVYTDTLTSMSLCDSIIVLTLSVNQLPTPVISKSNDTLYTQTFSAYQWLHNGTQLGTNNNEHVLNANGSYSVVVTDANGCTDTSAIINVTGVSVTDVINEVRVSIFPNPNKGSFTILFSDNDEHTVYITDAMGRLMLDKLKIEQYHSFNLVDQSAGIYFVHVLQGEQWQSFKISTLK